METTDSEIKLMDLNNELFVNAAESEDKNWCMLDIADKYNYIKSKAKRYKMVNTRTWRFIFLEH